MKIQLHPKPENPNSYRHPESSRVKLLYAMPFFVRNNKPVAHRVRSGQIYYRHGEYLHAAFGFWCEGSGFDSSGMLQDNLAPGVAMCWACEAKAVAFNCPSSAEILGRHFTLTVRKLRNKKPMSKTAVIMSEAEAMALPQSKRPLNFRVPSKIYHDVFEAVGSASLCWQPRPSGVFDTNEASNVAVNLCFKIADELERLGVTTEMMRDMKKPGDISATGLQS